MANTKKLGICLWFDGNAEEAAKFYTKVFKGKITGTKRYREANAKASGQQKGTVMTVSFTIMGQSILGLNGGPMFKFSPATSFIVPCNNQKEIDYYFNVLSAVPQAEQCGWLQDKFGVSWQIVPKNISKLVDSEAAMAALMQMKKIDVNVLQKLVEQ